MKLAEIYEILNEPRKALDLVYEGVLSPLLLIKAHMSAVIGSRKRRPVDATGPGAAQPGSLFEEKSRPGAKVGKNAKVRNRLSINQLKEIEEVKEREVTRGFKRCQELWAQLALFDDERSQPHSRVDVLERELLFESEKLVETFRETRNLFLTARVSAFVGPMIS